MKNPFEKQNNTAAWIAAGIGAVAAGAAAAYYLLKYPTPEASAIGNVDHATDYLDLKSGKKKKHKSDVGDLHQIVSHKMH